MSQSSRGLDGADEPQITWVGEQRLMQGYCGRAIVATENAAAAAVQLVRPIAVVPTRLGQGRVVRIGPPRATAEQPAADAA